MGFTLHAQDTIRISSVTNEWIVKENQFAVLMKEKWNIDDVLANQDLFKSARIDNPFTKGTSNKTVWLHLNISNPSEFCFLQFSHTHLSKLKIYFCIETKDSIIKHDLSLLIRSKMGNKFKYPTAVIPKGKKIDCFVEFNPGGNTSANDIIITTQSRLFITDSQRNVYYGIYFGAMVLMIFIYGVVYSVTKNSANVFFAFFIVSFLMFVSISNGIYYLYLPTWCSEFFSNKWAPAIWINLSCLSASAFVRRYVFGNVSLKSIYISPHIIICLLLFFTVPFIPLSLFHLLSHINIFIAFSTIFYCFLFKSKFLYRPSKLIIFSGTLIFAIMALINILAYEGIISVSAAANNHLLEIGGLIEAVFTAIGHFVLYLKEQSDVTKQLIKEQERIIRLRMDENSFKRERVKNMQDKKERALLSLKEVLNDLNTIDSEITENENAILISGKTQAKVSRQIAESNFISKDILNSILDMVLIVDEDLIVIDYNDKFEKMNKIMGVQIFKGLNLISQVNPAYRQHYEKHYKLAFTQNKPITKPVFYKNAIVQEGIWLSITYKTFYLPDNPEKRYCIAFAKHKDLKKREVA